MLRMFGRDTTINEEFIAKVIGMLMEGRKFYRDKNISQLARENFL